MNRLKLAVIGVGALGRHHARILGGFDDVELLAVADTDPAAGRRVAEACGSRWVGNYTELFGAVDAAVLAVPTTAHRLIGTDLLSRGIATLVEKPLAPRLRDAEILVEAADRHETLLQVGHVERFNPATRAAAPACAQPKYIRAERLSPFAFRSTDIGVIHDLMIHDLDLALEFAGAPVRRVDAFGVSVLGGHEDTVQARLAFENGCIADLTANRVNPQPRRSMQVWSPLGCTTIDFVSRKVVEYRPSQALRSGASPLDRARQPGADIERLKSQVFGTFIEVRRPEVPETDPLTEELRSFVDCVREGRRPMVDGRAALRAMEVAERVLQSVEGHRWEGHAGGPVGPLARFPRGRRLAG